MSIFFIHMQLLLLVVLIIFLFSLVIAFMIYTIRYLLTTLSNLTFNPPKAYAFIETPLLSSMNFGVVVLGLIAMIALNSAYLFSVAILVEKLYQTVGIATPFLINIMEQLIRDIIQIYN